MQTVLPFFTGGALVTGYRFEPGLALRQKAFISLKEEYRGKVTGQEFIDFCRANMAAYKYPREVEFVDEIPKTASGKALRRLLREKEAEKRKNK